MSDTYKPPDEIVELVLRMRVAIRQTVGQVKAFCRDAEPPGLSGMVVVDRLFSDQGFKAIEERPLALYEHAGNVGQVAATRFHGRLSMPGVVLDEALTDELLFDILELVPPLDLGATIRWVEELKPGHGSEVVLKARAIPHQPRGIRLLIAPDDVAFRVVLRDRLGFPGA